MTGLYSDTAPFGGSYGDSLACSADGKTIVVSAQYHSYPDESLRGLVYVYDRVGLSTNLVGILTAPSGTGLLGNDLACSADGKTIVVGAKADNSAYVFDRVGNTFNEVGILTGRYSNDPDHYFCKTVACSADGNVIVVSDTKNQNPDIFSEDESGLVYVYDRNGDNFNEVGILTGTGGDFGISLATSFDGNTIVVGASTAFHPELTTVKTGVVYVYDREYEGVGTGVTYKQVGILTGTYATDASDYFGSSVATNIDGNIIIVGASGDEVVGTSHQGVTYVYDRKNDLGVGVGTIFRQVGILTGSNPSNSGTANWDAFGSKVACSADGNVIAISAPHDEIASVTPDKSGVIYTFNRQGDIFTEVGVITSVNAFPSGHLGHSIACSKDLKHIYAGEASSLAGQTPNYVNFFDQTTVARDAITATDTGVLITGDLNVTGDITAFYTSDERLKDNITPIDDPLEKVISISGNTFDWNQNSNKSGHDVGVIAQEIK